WIVAHPEPPEAPRIRHRDPHVPRDELDLREAWWPRTIDLVRRRLERDRLDPRHAPRARHAEVEHEMRRTIELDPTDLPVPPHRDDRTLSQLREARRILDHDRIVRERQRVDATSPD